MRASTRPSPSDTSSPFLCLPRVASELFTIDWTTPGFVEICFCTAAYSLLKMRGTLKRSVGFVSARLSRILSTLSAIARLAPIESKAWSSTVCPNECAHGRNESDRSIEDIGKTSWIALTFEAMLPCERMTPFGLPVVPLV
ncbi:MAG: hypothetical protein K0S65_6051 [Labilithrix sp.]|nr:hypothetical protein [Labilithrix sp.]